MGLDMFLNRYTYIGLSLKEMELIGEIVNEIQYIKSNENPLDVLKTFSGYNEKITQAVKSYIKETGTEPFDLEKMDLDEITGINGANKLKKHLYKKYDFSVYLYFTEEVGYWRKENAIHQWFVDNVQNGVDECETHEVYKNQLIELKDVCIDAFNSSNPGDYLPTQSGFFFGSTDYNGWYYKGLQDTMDIIDKVLEETDFEKQKIIYTSSW